MKRHLMKLKSMSTRDSHSENEINLFCILKEMSGKPKRYVEVVMPKKTVAPKKTPKSAPAKKTASKGMSPQDFMLKLLEQKKKMQAQLTQNKNFNKGRNGDSNVNVNTREPSFTKFAGPRRRAS
jgi:hypothetical protein